MNPNNPYLNKPVGKPASKEYLISNGIERNPVIEREINPEKVILQGLPSPDISTLASIQDILDKNLDFNPLVESKIRNRNSTPKTSAEELDEILSQYIKGYDINDYIENADQDESTDDSRNSEDEHNENEESNKDGIVNGMLALPPAPETPAVSGNGSEVEGDDVIIEDNEAGNESPVSSILFANVYDQADEDDVKIDSGDDLEESESATHDNFGTPVAPGGLANSDLEKATRPKSSSEEDDILIEAENSKANRSKRKSLLTKSLAALIVVSSLFAAKGILENGDSEVVSPDTTEEPAPTPPTTEEPAPTPPTTENSKADEAEIDEDLKNLKIARQERISELSTVTVPEGELDAPYNRLKVTYDDQAGPMAIEAVKRLQNKGVDIKWIGDPNTSTEAYIIAGNKTNTASIMALLNPELVDMEIESYFSSLEEDVE